MQITQIISRYNNGGDAALKVPAATEKRKDPGMPTQWTQDWPWVATSCTAGLSMAAYSIIRDPVTAPDPAWSMYIGPAIHLMLSYVMIGQRYYQRHTRMLFGFAWGAFGAVLLFAWGQAT